MAEFKDYVWLFPFIGAILVLIGLLTPAAVLRVGGFTEFYWMHGVYSTVGVMTEPGFEFVDIPGLLIPGIISVILLTVCAIMLFVSALTHRGKETPGSWIVLGILLIGGTIYFIAGSELGFAINRMIEYDIEEWISFWEHRTPGFAVIAPFIGGGLTLLGAILGKTIGRQEGIGIPKVVPQVEKPVLVAETPPPTPTPATEETKVARFCPECGTKIDQADATFCTVCGHKF